MADKTGIGDLLPILERLCLEYRAMKALLVESDERWRSGVSRYRESPKARSDLREQFREARESLQSGDSDALVVRKLKDALNKTTI